MQLSQECSFLSNVEEIFVGCQIIHTCLRKHRRHLRDRENLVSQAGEMLNNFHQCSSLTGTWSTGKHDFLNSIHFVFIFYILFAKLVKNIWILSNFRIILV